MSALPKLSDMLGSDRPLGGATNTVAFPPKAPTADDLLRSVREMADKLPKPEPTIGIGDFRTRSFPRAMGPAFRIIEDRNMIDTVEDWSEVRSPSRAARRRRQGHRQRIRFVSKPKPQIYQVGDTLVMHPETAAKFRRSLAERCEKLHDDAMLRAFRGGLV